MKGITKRADSIETRWPRQKEGTMGSPWILVAAILALGLLYVLVPVVADAFRRFRTRRMLRCPETGSEAEVGLDARKAALTSAFGRPLLRVKNCSLWPQREDCHQECLELDEGSPTKAG